MLFWLFIFREIRSFDLLSFQKVANLTPYFETHGAFSAALQRFIKLRDKVVFFVKRQKS